MRRLVLILLLIALGWMGYWAAGAIMLERGATRWFADRQAEGWVAEFSDVGVTGFPTHFRVTLEGVELADPDTGLAWTAPEFRFDAASLRPTTVTAIWPPVQSIASPFERIEVASDRMQGTVSFAPNSAFALQSSDIAMENVAFSSSADWTAALASGRLVTAPSELGDDAHIIDFEAVDLRLAEPVRRMLDPAGVLPAGISSIALSADVAFDAPWDRFAVEDARPQITTLDLQNLSATWGELDLRAAGKLTVDAAGTPSGQITIKAVNWREMLGMAGATGALPSELLPTVERGLEILARLSGPPDTLDAPLTFRNGLVTFGPIPLGPAPRLVIR